MNTWMNVGSCYIHLYEILKYVVVHILFYIYRHMSSQVISWTINHPRQLSTSDHPNLTLQMLQSVLQSLMFHLIRVNQGYLRSIF